jgi:DNA polymerase I
MAKRQKLVLIDGKALFYRAYHAIQHLTNAEGLPTNAVYGFAAMVLKAYADLKPDYVILTWDKAKTAMTQRVALYPEYKAKRVRMPDDFHAQIPYIFKLADALRMPVIELDNYEADDIIGALVQQAPKDIDVIIVTNDRDVFQLLDPAVRAGRAGKVEIFMQRRGMTDTEMMDADKVESKYGIKPAQIVDLKALMGDASDNIPGVAGVGEKTAVSLLQKYGSLEGVYQHVDEIPGKLQERLAESKDIAYLSQKLATIMTEAPARLVLDLAKAGHYDRQKIHTLFRELGFKSLLDKLPPDMNAADDEPNLFNQSPAVRQRAHVDDSKYRCVQTEQDLRELVILLQQQKAFAFDTETDSVDTMTANLVGMAFSFSEGEAFYLPVGHTRESRIKNQESRDENQLPLGQVIEALKPVLEDGSISKVGHNLKFDYQIMRRYGVALTPISFDTMIAAFVLNPLGRSQSLGDLAYRELGLEMIGIEEVIGKRGPQQGTFDLVTVEDATRYAAEDADVSWRLYQKLAPEIEKQGFLRLAGEIEFPIIPVLAEMELAGISLDVEFLRRFNKVISARILELEEEVWAMAGERFNISSPAQLGQILFGKLGLVVAGVRRGKSGGLSTAARELEKMRGMHPIIELIFEHRELVKLKSTYVDSLPKMVGPDGRVHTSFSQTIAQTGRLSSNNPNLQNIPIRTELGREIRKAFVAPEGRCFVSADYSQIELRVAAALSKDQAMIKAFQDGIDVHQQTAAEMYGVELSSVTKEQRYNAKTINFGVLYGMSAHGLAVATGMSREEAAGFIKRYYELRPALAEYIEEIKKQAREKEYTETLFGRRRPCPEINSNNHMMAQAAERYAVNVPIQGTAADIMKLAMVKLAPELGAATKMLLQIHDELIVETDEDQSEAVAKQMKAAMEQVYELGVPIAVDTSSGKTWGDLD